MDINEYKELIKLKRREEFPGPYEVAYTAFTDLGYQNQTFEYFVANASDMVERLREKCWEEFLEYEKEFTTNRLLDLINHDEIDYMTPVGAVTHFASNFGDHLYQLSLSNTQSRRSRAGTEFESIIELILMGARIPLDSQGLIGKQIFVDNNIPKLVDLVSPGVVEYEIDKNDVTLISAKTTLRERWQEVPEEMARTGASLMYLATLDEDISLSTQTALYEANVRLVTTERIKRDCYNNSRRILSFEELIRICQNSRDSWGHYEYSDEEREKRIGSINSQKDKHQNHPFVVEYYDRWLNWMND